MSVCLGNFTHTGAKEYLYPRKDIPLPDTPAFDLRCIHLNLHVVSRGFLELWNAKLLNEHINHTLYCVLKEMFVGMLIVLSILFLSGLEHQCIHSSAAWFCRITGWLMLEGPSGGNLVQSPAQAGPPRADYWGPSQGGFWVSPFFVFVLAVYLCLLSLRIVILVNWRGKSLFACSQGALFCCS